MSYNKPMSEFWAVLQHNAGTLHENSGELLAELADIARRQQDQVVVCAVVFTAPDSTGVMNHTPTDTTLLTALGVQRLYVAEHEQLSHYTTEGYVNALAWLVQRYTPRLVIASATADGRDCMPRLAARLHLPFAANCLGLDVHDDTLFALRAVYDGRAYIQTRTALYGRTALATLLAGVRGAPAIHPTAGGDLKDVAQAPLHHGPTITRLVPEIGERPEWQGIRRLAVEAPSPEEIELEAAERIVAGGRGVGREGFTNVATFARLLGAAVGATRVATDQGWIEHERQIGATGKSVRPRLYIACGISGAAQHTSGVREAQTVVAINPDRSAPIFALADLGLLGDANQILPLAAEMIEKGNIKEMNQ
jgi:electron transfer flavoprotein alpha subunit